MSSVYDTLSAWARKTSSFAELLVSGFDRSMEAPTVAAGERIYRLKHWPQLPPGLRTAAVFRTLSVMEQRPVNRRWILVSSRLAAPKVDRLLAMLQEQGAVDVTLIDTKA